MGSYTAENSPQLSCYPFPPLDVDGHLITFVRHGGKVGTEKQNKQQQKNPIQTTLKMIRVDLRTVKLEFLAAHLFHKQAKAGRPLFVREGENYWRQ